MTKSSQLMSLVEKLDIPASPWRYEDVKAPVLDFPIKKVDPATVDQAILSLINKHSFVAPSDFYCLTSVRPANIDKLKKYGTFQGKRGANLCYFFNGDVFITDGKGIYSPSQQSLIFLYLSK